MQGREHEAEDAGQRMRGRGRGREKRNAHTFHVSGVVWSMKGSAGLTPTKVSLRGSASAYVVATSRVTGPSSTKTGFHRATQAVKDALSPTSSMNLCSVATQCVDGRRRVADVIMVWHGRRTRMVLHGPGIAH